jgi:hypothetical protein
MGQATKGGMYCRECDRPVAAQKTTHGIRNTLAIPTMGATAKIEDWHCPNCGGPVVARSRAEAEKHFDEKQEARRQAVRKMRDELWEEVGSPQGSVDVVVTAFPSPKKKPDAFGKNRTVWKLILQEAKISHAQSGAFLTLFTLPYAMRNVKAAAAVNLLEKLREKGATAKVEKLS